MWMDKRLAFSEGNTAYAGATLVAGALLAGSDVVDLYSPQPAGTGVVPQWTNQNRDLGVGEELWLIVRARPATLGSAMSFQVATAAYQITLNTHTAAGVASGSVVATGPSLAIATYTTPQVLFAAQIPLTLLKQFIGICTVGATVMTNTNVGIEAFITKDPALYRNYAQANIG